MTAAIIPHRHENYLRFRKSVQRQGLKLLAIELGFAGQRFELKDGDADILVQIRGNDRNYVWQKEALLNVAMRSLPSDCDKIAWLDCDLIFKNEDWVADTCRELESYRAVQVFSWAVYLEPGESDVEPEQVPFGFGDGKQVYGLAYRVSECGHSVLGTYFLNEGHVGFGWAFRRSIIEELGFLDTVLLQNNDSLMVFAFFGSNRYLARSVNSYLPQEALAWSEEAWRLIRGSVRYCPGVVLHLWHGNLGSRLYQQKTRGYLAQLLDATGFDFNRDLKRSMDGLWEWGENSGGLVRAELSRYYQGQMMNGVKAE